MISTRSLVTKLTRKILSDTTFSTTTFQSTSLIFQHDPLLFPNPLESMSLGTLLSHLNMQFENLRPCFSRIPDQLVILYSDHSSMCFHFIFTRWWMQLLISPLVFCRDATLFFCTQSLWYNTRSNLTVRRLLFAANVYTFGMPVTYLQSWSQQKDGFLRALNKQRCCIQFTTEADDASGAISSLDCRLEVSYSRKFNKSIHKWPKHSDMYLDLSSNHPQYVKRTPISALTYS